MNNAPPSLAPFRQVESLHALFDFTDSPPGRDPSESPSYLGRGNFSTVFTAATRPSFGGAAGAAVALKRLAIHDLESNKAWRDVLREARLLARLQHPFVPRLVAAVYTKTELCLVMGRARGETLTALLRRRRGPLNEDEAATIAVQLLLALRSIHEDLGAVHRDVKPDNIVVAFGAPDGDGDVAATAPPPGHGPGAGPGEDRGSTRSWHSNKAAAATSPVLPSPPPYPAAATAAPAQGKSDDSPAPGARDGGGVALGGGGGSDSNKQRCGSSSSGSGSPDVGSEASPSARSFAGGGNKSARDPEPPAAAAAAAAGAGASAPAAGPRVPPHLPQVTLVDFGFARVAAPPRGPAAREAARAHDGSEDHSPLGSPLRPAPRDLPAAAAAAAAERREGHEGSPAGGAAEAAVAHTPCGSERFLAPEVLEFVAGGRGHRMSSTVAGLRKLDVFALGVVVHLMLGAAWPWGAKGKAALAHQMRLCGLKFSGPAWADVSEDARDFTAGLLHREVSERFSVDRALRHAWLAKALAVVGAVAP